MLQNISFEINPGETVAILGATGSGKTSLVNLIPRFYDATEGCIKIDGINVKEYELNDLRSRIGFVLQKSEIFSGSIKDNIRWGDEDAGEEEIYEAAGIAQADEYINSFRDGYDTIIGERSVPLRRTEAEACNSKSNN